MTRAIEQALGWRGVDGLGAAFARGTMPDPGLCARLLTPAGLLDILMRRSLSPPQFRCFQNGQELHPDAYLTQLVTRRSQALPMVNMDRLNQLMQSGCSVVLDALDSFDATMEVACRALQWWSREIVQVNTYLTTQDADGFALHWDDHDVIIVQIGGEKCWEVRSASRPAPMYRDAEPNSVAPEHIVWSGTMRRGDVMHIPRGYWHQATRTGCGAGYSLHMTFGFVKRTGVDWMSWVADHSRERELFRHDLSRPDLSGPTGADDRAREEEQLTAGMSQLLAEYPISAYLAAREQQRQPPRHVGTGGVFGPARAAVCITDFPPHIQPRDHSIEVVAAGKKITFATEAEPVLRMLLSGHPVELATATAATGIDADLIAQTLITEGVCAELTAPLSSGYTGMIPTASCSNTP